MSLVDAVKRAAKAHDDLPGFAKDVLYINQSGGGREMTIDNCSLMDNIARHEQKLKEENATLRAEVARLTEAIEWAISRATDFSGTAWGDFARELDQRASSPTEPEYDEVEVKKYFCPKCETFYSEDVGKNYVCCDDETPLIELTGINRIPRKKKEKKQAELTECSWPSIEVRFNAKLAIDPAAKIILAWEE